MALNIGSNVSIPENLDHILIDKMIQINGQNNACVWNVQSRHSDQDAIPLLTIPMAETAITDPVSADGVINIDLRQMNKSLLFPIRMRNSSAL